MADAVISGGNGTGTILIACGAAFPCNLTNLTSNPFINTIAEAGVFSNPTVVGLPAILAPLVLSVVGPEEPVLESFSPFDTTILTLALVRAWDRAVSDAEIEEDRLFGRRLPPCR